MIDYLPLFNTNADYESWSNDLEKKIKPNVSLVIDDNICYFNKIHHPVIHAKFDVKSDYQKELLRHTHTIKSLVVDGEKVNFPIPVSKTRTVDIDKTKISYNPQTDVHNFPSSYVQKNWYKIQLKPTDANIKITDCNSVLSLVELSGEKYIAAGKIENIAGEAYFNEDLNFLTITKFATSYGMNYGIVLAIKDENTDNYNIVNTTCVFEYTTGGLSTPTYEIGTTGQHTLEIELIDDAELGDLLQAQAITHVTKLEDITTLYRSFYQRSNLISVVLPNTLKTIGLDAFKQCDNLESITIPDSVTEIGEDAFFRCPKLTSITIPDSVTSIGNGAFEECSKLASVDLGNGVTEIGENVFFDCSALTSITIPDGVTSIGNSAFSGCESLAEFNGNFVTEDKRCVIIDDKLIAIAHAGLTKYVIPDNVIKIGNNVFYNCKSLTEITIPDSVTSIGGGAFQYCDSLTEITIPDSVTSIGGSAFYGCSNLGPITIPENVTSIGGYAFSGCSSLTSVYCKPTTPPTGDKNIFTYYNPNTGSYRPLDCKIYVPMASVEAYKSAEYWSDYANNIVGFQPNNQIYYLASNNNVITLHDSTVFGANIISNTYENGVGIITFDADVTSIGKMAFMTCTSLTSITIPDSVTSIGQNAFRDCSNLASVDLGNGVTSIGDSAFRFCESLTSITIPDSVTTIGSEAFRYCQSLTSITIPESVTSIGDWAFSYCSKLTSITIPEGVTSIGERAFYNCFLLTSITIPDGVTEIGGSAFEGCKSLASVYCNSITPPAGGADMFYNNASGRKIYVPIASVDAYKSAQYWSSFANAIEGYNF